MLERVSQVGLCAVPCLSPGQVTQGPYCGGTGAGDPLITPCTAMPLQGLGVGEMLSGKSGLPCYTSKFISCVRKPLFKQISCFSWCLHLEPLCFDS